MWVLGTVEIRIPADSSLAFTAELDLSCYVYENEPKVKMTWRFGLLQESPIQGALATVLPARKARPNFYYIDGRFVSREEFEKFNSTLHGEEEWYCTEKIFVDGGRGGETGWIAKDKYGRRYQVVHDQSGKASWHETYLLR